MADESVAKLDKIRADAQSFLDDRELAFHDPTRISALRKFTHFWALVGKSFIRNRGPVRASALAYTTLLALIPLLAVGLSVSSAMLRKDGAQPIQELIDKLVANVAPALNLEVRAGHAAVTGGSREVAQKINDYIANIQSGALGVTSMVALVFVAISLLRTIEATFNDIWGVTRGRSWLASIVQYWAAITLGSVILVVLIGVTTGPHLEATRQFLERAPYLASFVFQVLPYFVLSIAFGILYQLMPNTRVHWQAAWVGGAVGGVLWHLNSIFNVIYVSKAVNYSQIYGSLGLVPLFLVGLYFSWLILLFGAQVAYAFQNRAAYLQDIQAESVHQSGREFVALRTMVCVAQRFQSGAPAPSVFELARSLAVPSRLLTQILPALVQRRLLVEVVGVETGYAPGRPLAAITGQDILQALRNGRGQELATSDDPARAVVREELAKIQSAENQTAGALTLEALAAATADRPSS